MATQTPTPVEEWTLGKDNYVTGSSSVMVDVGGYTSKIYIDCDNHDEGTYAHNYLTPEQARALATMLLYAAEQVDPSGD